MGEDAEQGNNTLSPSNIKGKGKGKGGFKATFFIYALIALDNMDFVANMVSLVLYFGHKFGFLNSALAMMTIQAHTQSLLPKPCIGKSNCLEGGVSVYFYATLALLLALGAGGVKGALPALGADQFDAKDPKEAKSLASYFNWLLQNNENWWKGFLINTIEAFVGFVFLDVGKPFYRLKVPKDSPLTRVAQVIVVSIKNRNLSHPDSPSELYELNKKDSESNRRKNYKAEPSPWKVCTVTQVEEVKVLTRMLPIEQGYRMDPYLGSFQVPAASIPVIPLINFIFVPFARKITKHPSGITQLQRVGVSLVLSALSMSIAAIVEVKRRNQFLKNPLKPISLFWLSFQYGIFEIADMFTLVGLLEFFYKEAPAGMKSLSTSFTWISLSFGCFLSSIFVDAINGVTKSIAPSKKGWLVLNFFNYLYWAMWYKYKNEDHIFIYKSPVPLSVSSVPFLKTEEVVEEGKNGGSAAEEDGSKATNGGSTAAEENNGKT
ncbi:hypothetical protein ACJIZ3_014234 [Penstemon smallii]|uniref:Uncharacterized protein n=1 Tax=Penstemon smallii TaxID=265156 RepID=A0ABD3RQM0_9LAMI